MTLIPLWPIRALFTITLLSAGLHAQSTSDTSVNIKSPNGRYAVQFSDPRSDAAGPGRLWGKITVRDSRTGTERMARLANGSRDTAVFEGFSLYEQNPAWSPDGLYFAFWADYCRSEPAVPGGVVCHLHEVHFLSMKQSDCRTGLVLGRYAFAGWAQKAPHTVLEIPEYADSRTNRRSPCAAR